MSRPGGTARGTTLCGFAGRLLAPLSDLPKGNYTLVDPPDAEPDCSVTIEIRDDEFIIDPRDNPDQDKGPFNMRYDKATVGCQIAFKGIVSPERLSNGAPSVPRRS